MGLPIIATPTFELELPSTGQKIKYRPFLVKEEKLLLLALESEDTKQITTAIKSVLENCVKTKSIKIDSLPTFDIEFLFLNVRARSVGEEIELNIICPDDEKTLVPVVINVDDIKVHKNENHSNKIKLDDNLIMEMKYPSLDQFIKNNFDLENATIDQSFELVADCVNKIYNEEEVWAAKDFTKKELLEFLDQMNSSQFKQVDLFFETMPKLMHEIEVENPVTKEKRKVVLEGLTSFFE